VNQTDTPDRFPYPRQFVGGLFDGEQELNGALEELERLGLGSDSYEVLHGEQDARRLDPTGEAHGVAGKLIRALQSVSYEREHVRRHADHLQGGGYLLGVFVGYDEALKQRVANAMRKRGGEFINYYADPYMESL
jgi:hypothetical protein